MFGWRGRFGFISPSTMVAPFELQAMLPDGVAVVATNLGVRAHQAAEFDRAQARIPDAVELLVGEGAQAIVVEGVPVAVRQGYRAEERAYGALAEKAGVPITSAFACVVAGLRHLGATRPVVATAYRAEWNELIMSYLTEAELPPAEVRGLSVQTPAEAARLESTVFYGLARELVAAHPASDAIVLGARGDLGAVARDIERDLQLPVVYGTPAALWWALRYLGVTAKPGWGRLLATLEAPA